MDKVDIKRSANFSTNEISMLMELVEKHKNTSKCKKTGRVRTALNINKWKDIEREFNAQSDEIFRPYMVLKKKYQNLKNQVKRRNAKNKKEKDQKESNGSPAEKKTEELPQQGQGTSTISDYEQQLRKIIEPQLAAFDALAAANPLNINDILNDTKIDDDEDMSADFNQVPMTIPMPMPLWEQFNPSYLWEEYSKLKTNKSRRKNGQSEATTNSANNNKKVNDESMKFLREEHKLKMKILKTEHEQKMTMMKEEHELKMKVLQAQLEENSKKPESM